MHLSISHACLPKQPTVHTSLVMDAFGIDFETAPHVIAADLDLPLHPGDVVCFTGPSGSGKSSLLRAVAAQLPGVVDIDRLELPDLPLIDALPTPFEDSLQLLSSAGLGEAQLLLRTPRELSEGQRYRFRLAAALALQPHWVLADEFSATLDRTLAQVIAYNLRRHADRTGTGFLLATTHTDILPDLHPSLHVRCTLHQPVEITRCPCHHNTSPPDATPCDGVTAPPSKPAPDFTTRKKKVPRPPSASPTTSTSRPARKPIGPLFPTGTTAATTSASSASSPSCGIATPPSASASSPPHPSASPPAPVSSNSPAAGPACNSRPSTDNS